MTYYGTDGIKSPSKKQTTQILLKTQETFIASTQMVDLKRKAMDSPAVGAGAGVGTGVAIRDPKIPVQIARVEAYCSKFSKKAHVKENWLVFVHIAISAPQEASYNIDHQMLYGNPAVLEFPPGCNAHVNITEPGKPQTSTGHDKVSDCWKIGKICFRLSHFWDKSNRPDRRNRAW
jgi:hypothetical protein